MELSLSFREPFPGELATGVDVELVSLFAAARAGDSSALAGLYDRFGRELYGLVLWRSASATTAEDAVQELFCKIASKTVHDGEPVRDPRAWLLTAVRRCAIDLERRNRKTLPLEAVSPDSIALLSAPPESHREDHSRLARALGKLPPKLREAIYLRHWSGLSYADIGRIARIPAFTAASRCRLALARLRRALRVAEKP